MEAEARRPDVVRRGTVAAMIDEVGFVVPACAPRYPSNVLGGNYVPAERLKTLS